MRRLRPEGAEAMAFPSFFAEVTPIVVHDRLSEFLGAADAGVIEYRYADAVKLAGHSSPTVAGAYLLTARVLAALYPDELPERGEIQVDFKFAQDSGAIGVIAAVVGLITGAAGCGGFKGIAGHFSRRHLLGFEQSDLAGEICFTRRDRDQRLAASLQTRGPTRCCNGCWPVSEIPRSPKSLPHSGRIVYGRS